MLFNRAKRTELANAREALTVVVSAFAGRLDAIDRELGWLRAEATATRSEAADLPARFDAALAGKALEFVADAYRQTGQLQKQLAALEHPEALIRLASDAAVAGLLDGLEVEVAEVSSV